MEKTKKHTLQGLQKPQLIIKSCGSFAKIVERDKVSVSDISKALTFTMPNYWYSPKYKKKLWDGKIRFLKNDLSFPVGFINRLRRSLPEVTTVVVSNPPCYLDSASLDSYIDRAGLNTEERNYAGEALREAVYTKRGLLDLAANAGKSRIIVGVVASFPKSNFLVLAHRIDILKELKDVFNEFLPNAENYTLTTFQSAKKLDLEIYDGILADEAHTVSAKTFYKICLGCTNADIRLGFTATPKRPDGLGFYIEAVLGTPIYTLKQTDLIDKGISVKPTIHLVPFKVPFIEEDEYMTAEDKLVRCDQRNQLIAGLVKDKKEVLILFKRKVHGELLEKLIPGSTRIDGDTNTTVRDVVKTKFKKGCIDVLLSSSIFDAGINLNNIKTLVLAWGGKSPIALTQKIGRALRKAENKHHVDIYAIHEVDNRYFQEHSENRLKQFVDMDFDIKVKEVK